MLSPSFCWKEQIEDPREPGVKFFQIDCYPIPEEDKLENTHHNRIKFNNRTKDECNLI